jgi:hypothetical protein
MLRAWTSTKFTDGTRLLVLYTKLDLPTKIDNQVY